MAIDLEVRPIQPDDVPAVGNILYRSFNQVFVDHGYPPPIPNRHSGVGLAQAYQEYEFGGCLVAALERRVVGSAFYHRRQDRAGVGPVTVHPHYQGRGVGRRLMLSVIEKLSGCSSIRLYQDAFNRASFALYAKLGFEVRGVMAILKAEPPLLDGCTKASPHARSTPPPEARGARVRIREMTRDDLEGTADCDARLTGMTRPEDLAYLWSHGPSRVLEDRDAIRGYAVSFQVGTSIFLGPAAARRTLELLDVVRSICRSAGTERVTVRAPANPGGLVSGLFELGFELRTLGTFMVRGVYEKPRGVFLSALFPEVL